MPAPTEKDVQIRQIETEVGHLMFRKRDLEIDLKAVNEQIAGLIKERDELKK